MFQSACVEEQLLFKTSYYTRVASDWANMVHHKEKILTLACTFCYRRNANVSSHFSIQSVYFPPPHQLCHWLYEIDQCSHDANAAWWLDRRNANVSSHFSIQSVYFPPPHQLCHWLYEIDQCSHDANAAWWLVGMYANHTTTIIYSLI